MIDSSSSSFLSVPALERCDGVHSTFMVETVGKFRDRHGADSVHPSISEGYFIAHNNCANHQIDVWAFAPTASGAHYALVHRLADHPARVRLTEGGDMRPLAVCQEEWEASIN